MNKKWMFICLIAVSSKVYALDFFKSCDEKWQSAWEQCDDDNNRECWYLAKKYSPDCTPDDVHLTKYRDGRAGYDALGKKQALYSNERKKRLEKVEHIGLQYTPVNILGDQLGNEYTILAQTLKINAIKFSSKLKNLGKSVLKEVLYTCDLTLNSTTQIYKGEARTYPSLIPGATNKLVLYFTKTHKDNLYGKYTLDDTDKYLSISDENRDVKSIEGGCSIKEVKFDCSTNNDSSSGNGLSDRTIEILEGRQCG
jgi:hypothetical protein